MECDWKENKINEEVSEMPLIILTKWNHDVPRELPQSGPYDLTKLLYHEAKHIY